MIGNESLKRQYKLLIAIVAAWPVGSYAQIDFSQCLARLEGAARDGGIQTSTIDTVFATVEPRAEVVTADRNQAEFIETFADYLGRRVNEARVATGRALFQQHRGLLEQLTRKYGIPGQYIVAFWGLETNYGGFLGSVSVFDSLSTLACDARRGSYFTMEFINALRVVDRGDVAPGDMIGSWAGAMGQTQFMPTNYLRYAVDGDKDGRVDLWNSVDDALASAANYLSQLQWQWGERWGREVLLPDNFDFALSGRDQRSALANWNRLGITDVAGRPIPSLDMEASVIVPAGQQGPAFLVYDNFDVIMRWNRSEFFALTVGHLADRIAGGGPLARPPPADQRISRENVVRVQQYLVANGYDSGSADGILGPRSRAAIRELQKDRGLVADGFLSLDLLRALGIAED